VPRLLGLDIDSDRLRISAVESRLGRMNFLRSEEVMLPEDAEQRSSVITEQLAQWKASFSPEGVVLGLPLSHFSSRIIEMPSMNREDLGRALQFELEKYLPLPVDDYLHDFLSIKAPSALRTFVMSIKRETVSGIIKTIDGSGLKVLSVRCRVMDAVSRFQEISNEKDFTGIFVLTVDDGYEICCMEHSMPILLKKAGRSTLSDELERLSDTGDGRVYFSGEIDQLTAERFRGQKLQIPVQNALAASYLKKGRLNLDFVPPELLPPTRDYYPYLTYGFAAVAFVLYMLSGLISYYKDASSLGRIESRIEEIKGMSSQVIESRKRLDELAEERKSLLDFRSGSNHAIKTIKDLSSSVPNDTWIMSLTIDDKGIIEMEGFSRKTSGLIMALEKTGRYKNISFASPIISKDGEERFSLKLEGGAE